LCTDGEDFFSITTRIALFANTCDRPAFEPGFSFPVVIRCGSCEAVLMDYEALATESLTTMSERIRGALRADVVPERHAPDHPFPVRETPEEEVCRKP
jgi:hypothetical protein